MSLRNLASFFWLSVICLMVSSGLPAAAQSPGTDNTWTYWRGAGFDGHSSASGLPDSWDPEGGPNSNVLWKREDLSSRSTPVVMNGRVYTIMRADPGTPLEAEQVVCLNAMTGETLWQNRFNVWLSDVPDTRVGWSSVVADPETGNVYALGVCGYFLCINGETGETVWSHPLHEQFGLLSTYGGRTNFPIVHEDLVIISGIIINWGERAKPNHRLLAFNKESGELVWFEGSVDLPADTTYSSPSLTTIEGQRQLIMGYGDGGIWGKQPRTGRTLWNYQLSRRGLFATPLVVGNRVFASHSEENINGSTMGAVVALEVSGVGEQTKVKELWKIEELVVGRSSPVLVDGRLYVVDDRCKLWVINADTGEMIAERVTIGDRKQWASLLYADGKLYCLTENGRWAIMQPTEDGVEFLDKGRMRDQAFIASPVVAEGRLFFFGTNGLYCVGTGQGQPAKAVASLEDELPIVENQKPAWLQIVPAEALLAPGESIELSVKSYNALGQLLAELPASDVEFKVEGAGVVENGKFVAPQTTEHVAAVVTAKMAGASGEMRARVVPPLPWKFSFDELKDAPVTWVGARYRHVMRTIDGSPAMVKITTIPKGARSQAWMGPSNLANYTISADVKGSRMADQLPDIGLIAQGYTLDLMGNSQQLQIRTWTPQRRMAQTIDFPWQADVWYRMKFQASVEDDASAPTGKVAVLKAKVWPKDQAEPKDWTVTARDQSPQTSGSPGLFGNAKVAELYLDNIEVVPNS
ncbi:PQQ-binding-like beta-propeller repeat protein [Planctomycetaceae bacterium SH139]